MKTHIKEFLRFWRDLPAQNGLPKISAVRAENLMDYKDVFFLLERKDTEEIIVRQCGQYFSDAYECDMRGKSINSFYAGKNRARIDAGLGLVFSYPCGAINKRSGFLPTGESVALRSIILPLADAEGSHSFAIGIIEFVRNSGKAYLTPGGKISVSQNLSPRYLDIGYGAPANSLAA